MFAASVRPQEKEGVVTLHDLNGARARLEAVSNNASTATPSVDLCQPADVVQNFFMARTATLRRYHWDARQKMMEHESFFYQLKANNKQVILCREVTVHHVIGKERMNMTELNTYKKESIRFKSQRFIQYFCKNFPHVQVPQSSTSVHR